MYEGNFSLLTCILPFTPPFPASSPRLPRTPPPPKGYFTKNLELLSIKEDEMRGKEIGTAAF